MFPDAGWLVQLWFGYEKRLKSNKIKCTKKLSVLSLKV